MSATQAAGDGSVLQAGGTLVPGRHVYIARPEDAQLLRLLRAGEYVNVLSARQMGKSSLMVRTMRALQRDGLRTTAVDLAAELSGAEGPDAWFRGLLGRFCRDLNLNLSVGKFWADHPDDTPGQKLQRFFRDVAVPAASTPLIVFLDEIESTLKFDFADSLFTALRGMYNERALVPSYSRASFSLLGVAIPNELIKDQRTTPYNIGTTLELRSFDIRRDDICMLARSLAEDAAVGQTLLARVLYWTGGQPFLTLKLCADLREIAATSPAAVDGFVDTSFASLERVGRDVHFVQIVRFLQERLSSPLESLELYRQVLAGERIREQPSLAHMELKLSGLVTRDEGGFLTLYNRIYARLFDARWLHAIHKMFERQQRLLLAERDEELARLTAQIAREKGIAIAPLRAILEKLGEAKVSDNEIPARLDAAAYQLLNLRTQLVRLTNERPEFVLIRNQALAQIDRGEFDAARAALASGRDAARALRDNVSRNEAEFLADEAGIDHLNLAYRAAAEKYAEAANLIGSFDRDAQWQYLLKQAGALYDHGNEFGDNEALLDAIDLYHSALTFSARGRVPLDWARTQNNLGAALQTLGERESGTVRLEEAVVAYRVALEERTRERVPLDWAATQNNLGNALQTLGERESGTVRLEEAVVAYRVALEERTRERVPLDWAATQNNLGNALQRLGERESGTARLEEAVVAYRVALEERTRERVPLDWAATQNNLGNALQRLDERESGTARLEEAVVAYRVVLEERTRERVPLDWAATQNNLGNALQRLGERESGTARLEEAVAAYPAALEERTRERVPLQWAATQTNFGTALLRLGERSSGTKRLEEAVAAYRAALLEWTRERVPLQWAVTQTNFGTALLRLGERESGTARLEQAIATYRAALQERTRDRVPLDWAQTQNNLGAALRTLGERESGTARLEQAVVAYGAALEEYKRERVPLQWAATQANLGNALMGLGERESGTERLEQAVVAFRAALEEYTRERVPLDWATVHNNLGNALQALAGRESGTARLEQAVAAYHAALQERTRERVPLDWAQTQTNLGAALVRLGERESGTTRLEEAIAAFHVAIELAGLAEDRPLLDAAHSGLARARQVLKNQPGGGKRPFNRELSRQNAKLRPARIDNK